MLRGKTSLQDQGQHANWINYDMVFEISDRKFKTSINRLRTVIEKANMMPQGHKEWG
jgi:hypothetical protein